MFNTVLHNKLKINQSRNHNHNHNQQHINNESDNKSFLHIIQQDYNPIKSFVRRQYIKTLATQHSLINMFNTIQYYEFISTAPVWILGVLYKHLSNQSTDKEQYNTDHINLKQQLHTIMWFTYRRNMEFDILNTGINSDAGWGCMLRTGQMMCANALYKHLIQSQQNNHNNDCIDSSTYNKQYAEILSWFLDYPHTTNHPFSIHNILTHYNSGSSNNNNDSIPHYTPLQQQCVGQWFGPNTTWNMLSKCFQSYTIPNLAVYIPQNQVLYRNQINELCNITESNIHKWNRNNSNIYTNRYDTFNNITEAVGSWRSLLIVIPVRIGGDILNTDYLPSLLSCFQYSQSIGIVGGKPRSSLYFIGIHDSNILYIDPHTVQSATYNYEDLTDSNTQSSYHINNVQSMNVNQLDPSLAIGFYCHNKDDFESFWQNAEFRNKCTSHSVFNLAEQAVNYTYDESTYDEQDDSSVASTPRSQTKTESKKPVNNSDTFKNQLSDDTDNNQAVSDNDSDTNDIQFDEDAIVL